jgi:hypothetical protein
MAGSVFHKIRPPVKRVEFKEKSTTRGIRFIQSTVKTKASPQRSPLKRSQPAEVDGSDQHGFDDSEPLVQSRGKVSLSVRCAREQTVNIALSTVTK